MPRANHDTDDSLNLLREWREPVTTGRLARAGSVSVAIHVIGLAALFSLPNIDPHARQPLIVMDLKKKAIPLIAPKLSELTQKDPNQGKVNRELDIRSALPSTRSKARRFEPPQAAG